MLGPVMTTKHEIKTCPRCGAPFECKANNPVHCRCADVPLTVEQMEAMQERYEDCVCPACLAALAREVG